MTLMKPLHWFGASTTFLVLLACIVIAADTPAQNEVSITLPLHAGKINSHTQQLLAKQDAAQETRFIVKYKEGFNTAKLNKFKHAKNFGTLHAGIIDARTADLAILLDDEYVERIEIDQPLQFQSEVTWNVERVSAPNVWNDSTGAGIKVAILDTGASTHNDLLAGGWNVLTNTANYTDAHGHGTMMAGVLAATMNNQGIVGVSPSVDVYAVKITEGSQGNLSDALAGLQWAIDHDMNIVSISFGFTTYSQIFKEALQDAYDQGILLIAASGNDGSGRVLYPAAYATVIAVGSTDITNQRTTFSNYGLNLELVAPGADITTTGLGNTYVQGTGTSLSAPHVAGIAALDWAYNRSLTNVQLRGKLRNDAIDLGILGRDDEYGYGLVQANLYTTNYSWNDTYYYEIFNITNYGLSNQAVYFWLNGTGTIDDLMFTPGHYLLRIPHYPDRFLHVDENGTLFILVSITRDDNFTMDSGTTSDDGVVWNDSRYIRMKASTFDTGGECWNYTYTGTGEEGYTKCIFATQTVLDRCTATYHCNSGVSCSVGTLSAYQTILNGTNTIRSKTAKVFLFDQFCDKRSETTASYAVVYEKRFNCSGTSYTWQGHYGTGTTEWINAESPISCPGTKTCDPNAAQDICTTISCTPATLCRQPEGTSCSTSADCFTGHVCSGGVCADAGTQTTDLIITDIIALQVVPYTTLVTNKTTLVRVYVLNNGSVSASARVRVSANSSLLNQYTEYLTSFQTISAWDTAYYDITFIPTKTTTNANITAEVELNG
jgi:hypothetical protein